MDTFSVVSGDPIPCPTLETCGTHCVGQYDMEKTGPPSWMVTSKGSGLKRGLEECELRDRICPCPTSGKALFSMEAPDVDGILVPGQPCPFPRQSLGKWT